MFDPEDDIDMDDIEVELQIWEDEIELAGDQGG